MASDIRNVGVIGIGLMGSGIAQVAAAKGFDTVVVDVTSELLEKGMERIRQSLERLVESHTKSGGKSGIPTGEKEKTLSRLRVSTDRTELLKCDIIIEAIVENEGAKKEMIHEPGADSAWLRAYSWVADVQRNLPARYGILP
jgi:3-hydroxybutyryl-CoA dehydrogenase